MTHSMLKEVFSILGCILIGSLLFSVLFTAEGQTVFWTAIRPAMEEHWQDATLNNGASRSYKMDEMFDDVRAVEYTPSY